MSRIPTPANIDASPATARPVLEAVKKQMGSMPAPARERSETGGK